MAQSPRANRTARSPSKDGIVARLSWASFRPTDGTLHIDLQAELLSRVIAQDTSTRTQPRPEVEACRTHSLASARLSWPLNDGNCGLGVENRLQTPEAHGLTLGKYHHVSKDSGGYGSMPVTSLPTSLMSSSGDTMRGGVAASAWRHRRPQSSDAEQSRQLRTRRCPVLPPPVDEVVSNSSNTWC